MKSGCTIRKYPQQVGDQLEMTHYLWQHLRKFSVPTLSDPFSKMIITFILLRFNRECYAVTQMIESTDGSYGPSAAKVSPSKDPPNRNGQDKAASHIVNLRATDFKIPGYM